LNLLRTFSFLLKDTSRLCAQRFEQRAVALGLTLAKCKVLGSPLSQSELADMLSVSGASMVHMIDRLVKAGLVIREPSISDRRVNRIVITDAGHRLCADLKNETAAVRQQLVASIELEKLALLTELLEQVRCILQSFHGELE
jgi:MarR family transcriptional regulator for hemolysin